MPTGSGIEVFNVADDVDVLVVGARVAGSVTAALLGDAGYRVLLVDAATFPSDTISTHFFRGAGLGAVLSRLGLMDRVLALGCPPLTVEYDYEGTNPEPSVGPPQDPGDLGFCLSCRRLALDALLVERARSSPGVEVLEGAVASRLVFEDGRVVGAVVEHAGTSVDVRARLVVGADGRGSHVARWVEAREVRRETASRALYFRYLNGFPPPRATVDGPEFSVVGDEMAYVFPSDGGVTCIAVSINLEVFQQFRNNRDAGFEAGLARHVGLFQRYRAAAPVSGVLGSGPVDAIYRQPAGPGWALVGDAGMHQDPWTGLGMDNAGTHATFLVDAIDNWLSGRSSEGAAFAEYGRRREDHALEGFNETARLGRDLSQLVS
jgi:menaquinone-9 beta-reductase